LYIENSWIDVLIIYLDTSSRYAKVIQTKSNLLEMP